MYSSLNHNKSNLYIKAFLVLCLLIPVTSFSQKKDNSVYKREFKQVKSNSYNNKLISFSDVKPDKKWDSYNGSAINTNDSLCFFNDRYLSNVFPTNTDKIRNKYLAFYFSQKTAKCPTLFSLLKYYDDSLMLQIAAQELPKEIRLLPAVLSAYNPNSNNGIGGSGYWHLNYPQAIKYGLTVNELVDERKDFEKSTIAATAYIADLYKMYQNWELTITAYSSGVVTVNRLLKRHSAKTYKEIYPYLPEETKDLVQAFVAMNYIYSYHTYGAVTLKPIIKCDTVLIERKLKFEAINHVITTKSKDFAFLNPILNREVFPNNFTAYFPKGKGSKFTAFKDSIYFYQDSVMLKPKVKEPAFFIPKNGEPYVYTVRSGDVLGLIADRNNVRVSQLQTWNNLNGTMINVGQKLTIYSKSKKLKVKSEKVNKQETQKPVTSNQQQVTNNSKPKTSNKKPVINNQQQATLTTYTVKSGDNLWIIAKNYSGVSAQNLMDFNQIDGNLTVGQKINIPKY